MSCVQAIKTAKDESELHQMVEGKPMPKDSCILFLKSNRLVMVGLAFWYYCRNDARGLAIILNVTPPSKWTVIEGQGGFYGPYTKEDCDKVLEQVNPVVFNN